MCVDFFHPKLFFKIQVIHPHDVYNFAHLILEMSAFLPYLYDQKHLTYDKRREMKTIFWHYPRATFSCLISISFQAID